MNTIMWSPEKQQRAVILARLHYQWTRCLLNRIEAVKENYEAGEKGDRITAFYEGYVEGLKFCLQGMADILRTVNVEDIANVNRFVN